MLWRWCTGLNGHYTQLYEDKAGYSLFFCDFQVAADIE